MRAKVRKWGNSLGLRMPKAIAAEAAVEEGATVDIRVVEGAIVIRPVEAGGYALGDLLAGVTSENLHGEVDTGQPRGSEAW